ncbi:hypothetical protein, partial [Mycobacteroides abscessus]|uniref:hypothetical protein n=1 Tax=Mycobacteroides abscessus TaxID=36809 RepID=UPI0010567DF2
MLSSVLALLLLSFARQARPGWPWWRVWGRLGERRYQPDYFRFSEPPWKSRRLLTLETRMQVCRRNSLLGS